MKRHQQYRQGDVLVESVETIPEDAVQESSTGDRVILAYGEATGHHHAVPLAHAAMLVLGAEKFLRVNERTQLRHEEHGPIWLLPADHVVVIQREYDPSLMSRTVVD